MSASARRRKRAVRQQTRRFRLDSCVQDELLPHGGNGGAHTAQFDRLFSVALEATRVLAQLYASARLYINFFQPSFKLKAKTRDGARVSKTYHPPATPCDRLLASAHLDDDSKARLREEFVSLDPVLLLRDIRAAQQAISELAAVGSRSAPTNPATDLAAFLSSLRSAWKDGEVRPTHRKAFSEPRWWRTRQDPFADAWPLVEQWLTSEPTATAKELLERLSAMLPDVYAGSAQLRTLQRRMKTWRVEKAKDLILGKLRRAPAAATQA